MTAAPCAIRDGGVAACMYPGLHCPCRITALRPLSAAPLRLARYPVVVTVHLGPGTMPDEIRRLRARTHVRAMRAPIAFELGRRRWRIGPGCRGGRSCGDWRARRPRLVMPIPVPGERPKQH